MSSGSVFSRFSNFMFSKDFVKYVCSTHFWGPVSNFGIPIAAVMDTKKDPVLISGAMTGSLVVYSLVFMRYSMAITPRNYLLFGCHFVNECAQLVQGFRFVNYWYLNGDKKAESAPITK
ncbi:mitochondrial pyruvate carrier [Dipodascopsis uninucleata]